MSLEMQPISLTTVNSSGSSPAGPELQSLPGRESGNQGAGSALLEHFNKGISLEQQGDLPASILCFEACLQIDPSHKQSLFKIALMHHKIGNNAESINVFQAMAGYYPEEVTCLYNIAAISFQSNDSETGIQALHRALAVMPAQANCLSLLGNLFEVKGDYHTALALYGRALLLPPGQRDLRVRYAEILRLLGRSAEGASPLLSQAAMAEDAGLSLLEHFNKGVALEQQGDLPASILCFEACLQIDPRHKQSLFKIASIHRKSGNTAEAINILRKMSRYNPDEIVHLYNIAALAFQSNDNETAILALRHALAVAPIEANCLSFLGNLVHLKGDYHTALALHSRAFLLDPDQRDLRVRYAQTLRKSGRSAEGASILLPQIAMEECPNYVLAELFLCMLSVSDTGQLLRYCKELLQANPTADQQPGMRFIISVLKFDPPQIQATFTAWVQQHYYQAPYAQTFYMRHVLARAGEPTSRRQPAPGKRAIFVSSLSHEGRFAHTVYNYLAAWLFCDRHGFELFTPEWQGHYIFQLDDPPITRSPTRLIPNSSRASAIISGKNPEELKDNDRSIDLFSPHIEFLPATHRDRIRDILTFRGHWKKKFGEIYKRIKGDSRALVCLHIRHGDMDWKIHESYGKVVYSVYTEWLNQFVQDNPDIRLYVCTDEPLKAKHYLAAFQPVFCTDVLDDHQIVGHILDFYMLCHADVAAISRGWFGSLACALNANARHLLRPDDVMNPTRLVEFSPFK